MVPKNKIEHPNIISHLRSSINSLIEHPIIFYPFILNAVIQIFILEVLFFAPRFPLNIFFTPIISTFWGEQFAHFPNYFSLLPKIFQYTQFVSFIFLSGFFISVGINIIQKINDDQQVKVRQSMNATIKHYVHIFFASLLIFSVMIGFLKLFDLVIQRALIIRSQSGIFFIIKRIILDGTPYFNFLISILITALFVYVLPGIVLEKRKIFGAIFNNFKTFFQGIFFTIGIVLLPTLLYLPVLLIRSFIDLSNLLPEWNAIVLLISIIIMAFIDTIIYTAITIHYLLLKENK